MTNPEGRMPIAVSQEQMEAMAVQLAEARKVWEALEPGSMIEVSREKLIALTDTMLDFSYFVLGWAQ